MYHPQIFKVVHRFKLHDCHILSKTSSVFCGDDVLTFVLSGWAPVLQCSSTLRKGVDYNRTLNGDDVLDQLGPQLE
jgi:hypothetical protein